MKGKQGKAYQSAHINRINLVVREHQGVEVGQGGDGGDGSDPVVAEHQCLPWSDVIIGAPTNTAGKCRVCVCVCVWGKCVRIAEETCMLDRAASHLLHRCLQLLPAQSSRGIPLRLNVTKRSTKKCGRVIEREFGKQESRGDGCAVGERERGSE